MLISLLICGTLAGFGLWKDKRAYFNLAAFGLILSGFSYFTASDPMRWVIILSGIVNFVFGVRARG